MTEHGTSTSPATALWAVAVAVLLGMSIIVPAAFGSPIVAASGWALCLVMLGRSNPRGVLSFEFMYLLILGLFHLGLVVPEALGVRLDHHPEWLDSGAVGKALGLFCMAIFAFTLGVRLGPHPDADPPGPLTPERHLFLVGLAVALCGAGLLLVGIIQSGLPSRTYEEFFAAALSQDMRVFSFGLMLFPIGVVVAAVGAEPRQMSLLAAIFAAMFAPLFLTGFRGHAIVHGMALLAVWVRKDARLARRVAAVVGIAVIVLVPAVKMTRNLDMGLAEAVTSAHPLEFVFETGGSLRALVVTCERVDSTAERLWMGRSYTMAAQRIIPNLSRRWKRPSGTNLSPNFWATMYADTWLFENGGGIGFSGVAEPYLNFGWPGVVLFFLLLGCAVRVGDRWLASKPHRAAVVASSFGFVLWTVRNDAMAVARAITVAALVVVVAWAVDRLGLRRSVG